MPQSFGLALSQPSLRRVPPLKVELRVGVEPTFDAYQASVLPLDEHSFENWSGQRDSNSLILLGRQMHNPYAMSAHKLVAGVGFEPTMSLSATSL